jgi:hypothetical protein
MAKQYFQGKAGFDMLLKKKPSLKAVIATFKNVSSMMYLETDDGVMGATPLIKIVSSNEDAIHDVAAMAAKVKTAKVTDQKGNKFLVTVGADKFYLYKSGGRLQNVVDEDGNSLTSKTPSTAQQEDGTRFCLEYYATNKKYPEKTLINKAVGFEFGKDWHDSFEKTVNAVLTVLPKSTIGQYDFYRDSNPKKPQFLNQITDSKVLPDSKDNWNPSDIWAVKKTTAAKLTTAVDALHKKLIAKKAGIEDLNKFVEDKLKTKEIVGISLKKVAGPKATISKIEVDSALIKSIKFIKPTKKFDYKVSNSYFDFLLDMKVFKDTVNYRFRFRPRGASGELNTYGEGQPQDAKVWDGAISRDMLNGEFPGMLNITSDMKKMPKVPPTVDAAVTSLGNMAIYKKFAAYVKRNKFEFVNVSGMSDKMGDYEVRRAVVLLYYIFALETASDQNAVYKQMYLAAKKMNAFSSVHYKVY